MTSELRIDDALERAVATLDDVSDSPRLDAELLLARAIDVSRAYLIAHPEDTLDEAAQDRFFTSVTTRHDRVPLAYITGSKGFWTLELSVSPATLVPRPETETLVEQALRRIPRDVECSVLDLGTGSGAVAIAIATERPLARVTATDINTGALDVARQNARRHDASNVDFVVSDWCAALPARRFDLIVSNPPYVAEHDPALLALRHEPAEALISGSDGLDAIRTIAADASGHLARGGHLLLEHGASQQTEVADILDQAGWTAIDCHLDLSGRPRVSSARGRD